MLILGNLVTIVVGLVIYQGTVANLEVVVVVVESVSVAENLVILLVNVLLKKKSVTIVGNLVISSKIVQSHSKIIRMETAATNVVKVVTMHGNVKMKKMIKV